LWQPTVKISRS